jgi:ankyrin repeat protein
MYLKSKKKNYDQHEAVKHVNLKQIKNQRGDSLLHISVLENYIELVEYLLNKGLDVNSQNEDGNTPLHLAVKTDNKEITKILLQWNADLNISNKKEETVLDIASVNEIFKINLSIFYFVFLV